MTALNAIEIEKKHAPDPTLWLERHGDFLYRFALSKIYERSLAEDLVQETLLAALGSRGNFANNSAERTWLAGILKHKIADHFRRITREISLDETFETDEFLEKSFFAADGHWKPEATPLVWKENPAELLEQKEFCEFLRNSLSQIPEKLAAVFMLSEIQGFSSDEICQMLDISQENLYVMLHRARFRLRHLLEKNWFAKH